MGVLLILAIPAAAILASAFLATYKHAKELLAFLVGVSAGFVQFQVQGVHVFTIVVILFAVFSYTTRRDVVVRSGLLVLSSILLAGTTWLGALTKSSDPALQLLALAVTAALFLLRSDARSVHLAKAGLLVVTTAGAIVAVLQGIGALPNDLFTLGGNTESLRAAGIYPEPDWLGLYSAVGVVLAFTSREIGFRARMALIAINLAGVALSSARSAVIALVIGAIWAAIRIGLTKRSRSARGSRLLPLLAVAALGLMLVTVIFPGQIDTLTGRIQEAIEGNGAVVTGRWAQIDALSRLSQIAPWYGNGLSASGRVTGFGGIDFGQSTGGATNGADWLLSLWGDGKLLALPLITMLVLAALFGNIEGNIILLIILTNSLFSNAFSFPITWLALAISLMPKSASPSPEPGIESSAPQLVHRKSENRLLMAGGTETPNERKTALRQRP